MLARLLTGSALGHEVAAVLVLSATIGSVSSMQRIDWTLLGALSIIEEKHVFLAAAASRCSVIVVLYIELDSTKFDNVSTTEFVVLKNELLR